ncbi:carbohydrate esterase family 1 protein [Zasmidium cellare ATCC 36951]|uniref:feruloyl esterase n=1 Tax=Zasmidium cellare ATCC 36951 TaxID=1080233 RepID=A0A6A6CQ25_ZASCE|nr:carbohydrate esterase family 1 protein [Zasmidium cellare ATCC 36951]KAF2169171.1 carbohydrate esterase family 1 protein [Zasmidium cellare ATCC 36951]
MIKSTSLLALWAASSATAAPGKPSGSWQPKGPWGHPWGRLSSSGCGKTHHTGYNNDTASHSIISGGLNRTYGVNVPNDYNDNPSKARALIIDYHGSGGNAWQQYDNSQYYNYPSGEEYVVVYPNAYGSNHSWQGPNYAPAGVSDLNFTIDLLDHIEDQYCIDTSLVYASGKSNGGGFVDTLACSDQGDRFAAFAIASGAMYTDTSRDSCSKKRAILESHGDMDSTIPYHPTKPGRGGPIPDISQWVSWWGYRTCGSSAKPQNSGDLGGYNTTSYSCGNWDKVIDHYQVFDLGHCWPSSTGENYDALAPDQDTRKCLDKVLDYTPVVLNFFSKWTLSNSPKN